MTLTGHMRVLGGVCPHVGVDGPLALVHKQPVEPNDTVVVGVGEDGDTIDDH